MTTVNTDIDTLASEPFPLTLESGTEILVQRLKTRQLMRLLKIITRGAGDVLTELKFSSDMDAEMFTGQLLGAVILSIPEAEDETIDFVKTMVLPATYIEAPRTPAEREANEVHLLALSNELDNPELGDLVTIMEQIITNEAQHMLALGKRLALLLKVQQKSATAKQSVSSKKSSKA
jgi:hypothetical protein